MLTLPPTDSRPVPGWDGYRATPSGDVWTCRGRAKLTDEWRKMKPRPVGKTKYAIISLCSGGGKPRPTYVHHIILWAFVGPCPDGLEAIHLNDDQSDNRAENLEWGTHKRNCELRRSNGRDKLGEDRKNTKLTGEQVLWVLRMVGKRSLCGMARELGVSLACIQDIVNRVTWKHL